VFPVIDVEGDAQERGRQYGEGARERVRRSVTAYEEIFAHYTGWTKERVREEAERFRKPSRDFGARYLDEIAGIAEGADVPEVDVLAINVRTEIMCSAEARKAAAPSVPPECSAFAVLGERAGGSMLVGQNWDWLAHAFDTTIVLRSRQPDAPNLITVVEAGLLAKVGLNSSGVAVATNLLITDADRGDPGVPYHILLRALFDVETPSAALALIQKANRASSANFIIGGDEVAIDVEAAPGAFVDQLAITYPADDLLLHFNHFAQPVGNLRDVSVAVAPNSPFRQARVEHLVRAERGPLDLGFWQRTLGDHAMFPESVCHHPDPRAATAPERHATVLGVVMEPATRSLWLAPGSPCSTPWEAVETDGVLDKPSALDSRSAA
jgi:isopenicillin-N N-acyltransferase like protein